MKTARLFALLLACGAVFAIIATLPLGAREIPLDQALGVSGGCSCTEKHCIEKRCWTFQPDVGGRIFQKWPSENGYCFTYFYGGDQPQKHPCHNLYEVEVYTEGSAFCGTFHDCPGRWQPAKEEMGGTKTIEFKWQWRCNDEDE